MGLFKKLFSRKSEKTEVAAAANEPWYNEAGQNHATDSYQNTDPLTSKKKKKLMDPVLGHIAGNPQDSNSIKKNGV